MSVLRLTCRITIEDRVVDFCHEVEVQQSYKDLGARCKIKLPRRLFVGKQALTAWLQAGMKVTVAYGYDGALRTEFEGYVSSFKPGIPLEILCEDEFYLLRQKRVTLATPMVNVKLGDLLREVFRQCELSYLLVQEYELLNFVVPKYQVIDKTGLQVLEELKEKYGLYGYLKNGKFHAGAPYDLPAGEVHEHVYAIGQNVLGHDLSVVKKEELKLSVSVLGKVGNEVQSAKRGDGGGLEIRRVLQGTFATRLALEEQAALLEKQYRYDGLQGKLTAFNVPTAEVGDWAVVRDPERLFGGDYDGTYCVVSVRKTFGVNGSRREVELGVRRG